MPKRRLGTWKVLTKIGSPYRFLHLVILIGNACAVDCVLHENFSTFWSPFKAFKHLLCYVYNSIKTTCPQRSQEPSQILLVQSCNYGVCCPLKNTRFRDDFVTTTCTFVVLNRFCLFRHTRSSSTSDLKICWAIDVFRARFQRGEYFSDLYLKGNISIRTLWTDTTHAWGRWL